MDKPVYTEIKNLPEKIMFIYFEEERNRWKHRKLTLTTDTPFLDGFVTAVIAACIATPFLNFHGKSVESSGPIILLFWGLGWLVSKSRHSEWRKNYEIEEGIEKSEFIRRANNGEFENLKD